MIIVTYVSILTVVFYFQDLSENQGLKMRRLHLFLQLPWSSDRLLRLLGSSHRTDQVNWFDRNSTPLLALKCFIFPLQSSAPEYKFLVLELGGERRFLSTAAKRMEKMYAHSPRRPPFNRIRRVISISCGHRRMSVKSLDNSSIFSH